LLVGESVGERDGLSELGDNVGDLEGLALTGEYVGVSVGACELGDAVGDIDGCSLVGEALGCWELGAIEGAREG
jgi:hypothetical protein